jgi:hypothetical protein
VSEHLRRIQLPADAQGWDRRLGIRDWINKAAWDPEPRFQAIDGIRRIWLGLDQPDLADDPEVIATMLFDFLSKDTDFHRFVVEDADNAITDPAEWEGATRAYTWAVLQRYNRELGGPDD